MAIKTYGTMAVDWEQRIDFDRLRRERLARIKKLLAKSELGAVLCFDMNNVRYITATHIGTWAQDKISRFTLLPQNDEPILWDFGSAARHHQHQLRLARRALARRHSADARRDDARDGPLRGRRPQDSHRAREARPAQGAGRRRRRRAAGPVRAAEGRPQHRRRPAADVGRARDQDAGRDLAADALGGDGRRRLLRAVQGDEARHARERGRRARRQDALRDGLRVRRRRQRHLRRALQPASARVLRSRDAPGRPGASTTSCTPTWATAPATTAASRSARRRARWSTPTSAAATTSTRRSS